MMHTHADLPSPFAHIEPEPPRAPGARGIPDEVAASLRARFGAEWPTDVARRQADQPPWPDFKPPAPVVAHTHDDLPPPPPAHLVLQPRGRVDREHDPRFWVDRHQKALKRLYALDDPEAGALKLVEDAIGIEPSGEVWSRARWLLELLDLVGDRRFRLGTTDLVGLGSDPFGGPFFVVVDAQGYEAYVPDELLCGPYNLAGAPWARPDADTASALSTALIEAAEALRAERALAFATIPPKTTDYAPAIEEFVGPTDEIPF